MIAFLLVNISIPFLSLWGRLLALIYLPPLLLIGGISLRKLIRPWRFIALFAVLLAAIQTAGQLIRGTAFSFELIFPLSSLVPVITTYGLFLSLGTYLLHRIPEAEMHASLLRGMPPLPGRNRIAAIAGLAFCLFIRLRGTVAAVSEAVHLRAAGRYRLRSARDASLAITRLGTEMALGTADALVLRSGDTIQPSPVSKEPRTKRSRKPGFRSSRSALYLELSPLLIIATVDIFLQLFGS